MLRFKAIEPALVTRGHYPFEDGWHGIHNPFVCHFGSSTKDVTSTSTNTAAPWTPQQQSLETGFNTAGNLLSQLAPAQTYPIAPLNSTQTTALQGITNQATAGTPITGAANTFDTNLENGQYLNSNPSLSYFQQLANSNLGLSNPGATTLQGIEESNPAASLAGNPALTGLANTNVGQTAPGASTLASLSGVNPGVTNAGTGTLTSYANGANLNSNPYQDPTAQSIEAQVIPQVASAFNNGNNVNNPDMAYAAANGVTAALAPVEYQNYQTQEGLQTNAANSLASNTIAGANSQGTFANLAGQLSLGGSGLSENAANALNTSSLTGTDLQSGAASSLTNSALSGGNLQATAAEGISQPYQSTLSNMVQGNAIAPTDQALSYADLDQMLGAGTTQQQQAQNVLTGGANTAYSSAESPYAQLAAYMQAVGGNYGGTTSGTATTPYFTNTASSDLAGATGGLSLLGTLGSAVGGGATAGSTAAGLASLFALL